MPRIAFIAASALLLTQARPARACSAEEKILGLCK
jgi:hypothetical protein